MDFSNRAWRFDTQIHNSSTYPTKSPTYSLPSMSRFLVFRTFSYVYIRLWRYPSRRACTSRVLPSSTIFWRTGTAFGHFSSRLFTHANAIPSKRTLRSVYLPGSIESPILKTISTPSGHVHLPFVRGQLSFDDSQRGFARATEPGQQGLTD
jgi:hypothetical protein